MPPKPWSKLRPKGRGLSNKECCPPSSSIRTKSSPTADDDPQDTLKNVLSEDQDEALCALGKLAEPALRQLDIFRGNFYEPGFLHIPILGKALKNKKTLNEVSAPHDQQQPPTEMRAHCMYPLQQNHTCTGLPCLPLGNSPQSYLRGHLPCCNPRGAQINFPFPS